MDKLFQYYYDYFINAVNDAGYLLLSSSVCIQLMSGKYNQWLSNKEVEAIETLPEIQKIKYWNLACKYQTDKDKRILASKTAYALELMTGKN